MFNRIGHVTMPADQFSKAKELITALGLLGHAQEVGADADVLSALTARVRTAEHEFKAIITQSV